MIAGHLESLEVLVLQKPGHIMHSLAQMEYGFTEDDTTF